jgi:SAM-dependent methyltransferase
MRPDIRQGNEGYAEEAEALTRQYESVRFVDVHRHVLHLIPRAPSDVVDIGAGTGRDASALAAMGHRVVAVEPTAEFRARAARLHPSPRIEWVNDHLPPLPHLSRRGNRFDVVMVTAVWIHLDPEQRREAMPKVAALLRPGGLLALNLRHGPTPPGRRRLFETSADETSDLAASHGLRTIVRVDRQADFYGRTEVTWTSLAFLNETPSREGGGAAGESASPSA